jgi:hypothetical protein
MSNSALIGSSAAGVTAAAASAGKGAHVTNRRSQPAEQV